MGIFLVVVLCIVVIGLLCYLSSIEDDNDDIAIKNYIVVKVTDNVEGVTSFQVRKTHSHGCYSIIRYFNKKEEALNLAKLLNEKGEKSVEVVEF